jgi:hypothetical protein
MQNILSVYIAFGIRFHGRESNNSHIGFPKVHWSSLVKYTLFFSSDLLLYCHHRFNVLRMNLLRDDNKGGKVTTNWRLRLGGDEVRTSTPSTHVPRRSRPTYLEDQPLIVSHLDRMQCVERSLHALCLESRPAVAYP